MEWTNHTSHPPAPPTPPPRKHTLSAAHPQSGTETHNTVIKPLDLFLAGLLLDAAPFPPIRLYNDNNRRSVDRFGCDCVWKLNFIMYNMLTMCYPEF